MATAPYVDINTIQNAADGDPLVADYLDAIRANLETLAKKPGCIISRSATDSVGNVTPEVVEFTATDTWDSDGFHDPSSNPSRATVPTGLAAATGSVYLCTCTAQFLLNATGYRIVYATINGAGMYGALDVSAAPVSTDTWLTTSVHLKLTDGQYVEWWVGQSSGGALNLLSARASMFLESW